MWRWRLLADAPTWGSHRSTIGTGQSRRNRRWTSMCGQIRPIPNKKGKRKPLAGNVRQRVEQASARLANLAPHYIVPYCGHAARLL